MAITTDDFNKIWASASPLTPYSFSASQYKEGWNFIGGTPPSRQMWDYLQKNNDEKMQYLANNYLPLSGGTLTGVVNGVTPTAGDNSTKIATTEFVNAKAGNYLPLSGGTMTGDIDFYDDLFLGTPADDVNPSQKSTFNGLYENKNDPHKYGGVTFHQATDNPSYRTQLVLNAGDGTNRNWFVLYGDAEGGLKYNGVSITDGSFLTVRHVTITTRSGTTSYSISAPAVSGYQFLCWVMSATSGYINWSYIASAWNSSTFFWIDNPSSGSVDCTALYVRKW